MHKLTLAGGSLKLHYHDIGAGTTAILLLHGFPFTSEMWRPQLQALSGSYRVIVPDQRGFGASQTAQNDLTMAQLADDAAELIEALGLRRAVIAGLSMGGYVAFELFKRHRERVQALILSDTRPEPDSDAARGDRARMAQQAREEGSAAIASALLPMLLSSWTRAQKHDVEAFLRDIMESVRPDTMEAALLGMANRADSRPLLAAIDVPTLVIVGAEDTLTPPDQVRGWAKEISNSRVEVVERAAHVPNLEQPVDFNKLVGDFLAGLSLPGGD